MYIIIIVYYINSNHNASHIVLEHNELRHRKIKKTFQRKVVLDVFLGDVFFPSPNKHVRPKKNPSSGGKSQNTYAAKLLDHLLKKAVKNAGDVILDDFWIFLASEELGIS